MQVQVVPTALHARPGPLSLTYYPRMPGNSTSKPGEKWAHQRRYMAAASADRAFQGARDVECPGSTLAAFVAEQRLEAIDLLKVQRRGGGPLKCLGCCSSCSWGSWGAGISSRGCVGRALGKPLQRSGDSSNCMLVVRATNAPLITCPSL